MKYLRRTIIALLALAVVVSTGRLAAAEIPAALLYPGPRFAAGDGAHSVAVADLNDDGAPDLATANYGHDDVSVLLGNGDGASDLVTANDDSDDVSVLLNQIPDSDGDGTLDYADNCPQVAGTAEYDGCPPPGPPVVGGVVELLSPPSDAPQREASDSGSSPLPYAALAGGAIIGTLAARGWYASRARQGRRWPR